MYQWLVHFYLVAANDAAGPAVLFFQGAPHAGINLFLLWVFGRTLTRGREPLITAFARRAHRVLPDYLEAYTRRVTIVWCIVCAVQLIVSAALFVWASLETWSFFVTMGSLMLVATTFVSEYLYRVLRYRDFPHVSIWAGIRMFTERRSPSTTDAASAVPNVPSNG
ncbi:MAG: hypothetical protein ACREUX_08755 [Burkholderiales bacterium]